MRAPDSTFTSSRKAAIHQRNHTLFRDWLIEHGKDASAYAELTSRLSEKYRYERNHYTEAKADFIAGILKKAVGRSANEGI